MKRIAAQLSRRTFLQQTTWLVGMAALVRLRAPVAYAASAPVRLQFLDADQADLLAAIVERMTYTGDPAMPLARDTDAVFVIDQALLQADGEVREQLGWLLRLFDWGPILLQGRFARFRNLSDDDRDDYIRGWATSRFTLRRMAFQALKNLSMLGYYADDRTWRGIGYHGPWAPRPRRVVRLDTATVPRRGGLSA